MGKLQDRSRQQFLHTFFEGNEYAVKEVNGFVLEKQIHVWGSQVAIYSKEAWEKRSKGFEKFAQGSLEERHIRSIMQR